MNKIIALALIAGGALLMIIGISATNFFSANVARFFTGSPTDNTVLLLIGGMMAIAVGLLLTLRHWKRA